MMSIVERGIGGLVLEQRPAGGDMPIDVVAAMPMHGILHGINATDYGLL